MPLRRELFLDPHFPLQPQDSTEPYSSHELLGDLDLRRLNQIFQEVMRKKADKMDPVRSKFGTIEKEEVTLSDKMSYVEEYAMLNGYFSFRQLLARQRSKMHVIVTFLAVLELMKVGKIQITQEKTFAEIMITSMM